MGIKSDSIPRIATAFGGGFAGCGLTCGAVTGAAMAISLVHGRNNPEASRDAVNEAVRYVVDNFVKEMGTCMCRDLTGVDLRTEEGRKKQRESGIREEVCDPAIILASRLAVEALKA